MRASGKAGADEVWDRYFRPARWAQWSPQIARVETPEAVIRPGLTGTVIARFGVRVGFTVELVDVDARTWTWRTRLGPVTIHLEHTVQATADGTRTDLRIEGPLPVVIGYAPLAQLALGRLVRR